MNVELQDQPDDGSEEQPQPPKKRPVAVVSRRAWTLPALANCATY